ncbi:MAG TPA: polysaccharide deacetylase family protein [Opitutales bacterium]|nr:polysaccharide deacetylase family protein [Opitutales bacterium]
MTKRADTPVRETAFGAVIRGSRERKELALVFTGGHFGEGAAEILDTLKRESLPGSFFFTGDFLKREDHREIIRRAIAEGHYVGPHSHAHLLYCPWEDRSQTLVTREEFSEDLAQNVEELKALGVPTDEMRWWIPPYEYYNETIAKWAKEEGRPLINNTPGTLSHADYTEEAAANFRSSETIFRSILDFEEREKDGLNGFLLLLHVGAGDGRTDKFHPRIPALIEELKKRGYEFKRVDELLGQPPK